MWLQQGVKTVQVTCVNSIVGYVFEEFLCEGKRLRETVVKIIPDGQGIRGYGLCFKSLRHYN